MGWSDTPPVFLAAVFWLAFPGLLLGAAMRLRGLALLAASPVLSIFVIGSSAVACGVFGFRWGSMPVLVFGLVLSAIALLVTRLTEIRQGAASPKWTIVGFLGGLALAGLSGMQTLVAGWRSPEAISQTYDAVFHYNAIATIVESGQASPFFLGTLMNPGVPAKYYPGAWHALAALTQANAFVAANVVSAVVVVVVWPAGCALLTRQILGARRWTGLAVPLLSLCFLPFPWTLLKWGVLWPNVLGLAATPVAIAATLSVAMLAKEDVIGRRQAALLLPMALAAIALAHPSALVSYFVVVAPILAVRGFRLARSRPATVTAAMILAAAAIWLASGTSLWKATTTTGWPAFENPAQAIGEALTLSPNLNGEAFLPASTNHPVYLVLAGLTVAGAFWAWQRKAHRWLVLSHVLTIVFYTLAASQDSPVAQALTGLWYNDSYRLAAMLPLTGVPLAAIGIEGIASALGARWKGALGARWKGALGARWKGALGARWKGALGARWKLAMPFVLGALLLATGLGYQAERQIMVAATYHGLPGDSTLLTAQEREFFLAVATIVPQGQVVAGNPWNGSPLLYPLTGTRVLFQHLQGQWTADQKLLSEHLTDVTPDVCLAAQRLHVHYLIVGGSSFWEWAPMGKEYPGLADPEDKPGFELVFAQGPHRLYRLTACGLGSQNY